MKVTKKPVEVEAVLWNGSNVEEIQSFMNSDPTVNGEVLEINTLEGTMTAQNGDWIIKGVKGEFYPCKPDIFEQTYSIESTTTVEKAKTSLMEQIAFPHVSSESFEAADFEYEVEIYLKGFDLEQIKSMATTHCSQEQWGIYIPKTAANASGGSIRVRKSVSVDDETKYELTTKTEAGDQGKLEHEIDTDDAQFEQFKRLADQGLIKTRYEFPGEVNGIQFTYEVDVFFDAKGNLVPWVKIDAEVPEGTVIDKSIIPLTYDEVILITPELKGTDEVLKKRIAKLYDDHFRAKNVYVGQSTPPVEEAAA